MTRHEFEVRYSEAQIRRNVWRLFRLTLRRGVHWTYWLIVIVACGLWISFFLQGGKFVFATWLFPTVLGVLVLVTILFWQNYLKHSLETFRRMKSPIATVIADDEALAITSDLGMSRIPWATFTERFDGPDVLYLKMGRNSAMTLPLDGVAPEAAQFIRDRVPEH